MAPILSSILFIFLRCLISALIGLVGTILEPPTKFGPQGHRFCGVREAEVLCRQSYTVRQVKVPLWLSYVIEHTGRFRDSCHLHPQDQGKFVILLYEPETSISDAYTLLHSCRVYDEMGV